MEVRKCFLFVEMFGNYRLSIILIQRNTIEEAIALLQTTDYAGAIVLVRGFNYDPNSDVMDDRSTSFYTGISGMKFLPTIEDGWFDWREIQCVCEENWTFVEGVSS